MELATYKTKLMENTLDKVYVFAGEEYKVMQIYINQTAKVTQKSVKYADSFADIYAKLQSKSLFGSNYLYVVQDDTDIVKNEKLYSQIKDIVKNDMLIFKFNKIDSRTKFYNEFKDCTIDFKPLSEDLLSKYIKKEINLSTGNIRKLINICDRNYGRILLEIDKIKRYDEDVNYAFEYLLKNGTIHSDVDSAVFDFIDSVLSRKPVTSFMFKDVCERYGDNVIGMLTLLYNNARNVLQVQTCDSNDIAKTTGLTSWQIKNAKKHTGRYTDDELIDLLFDIQKCQKGIVTGTIEEKYVLDYILVRLL